MDPADIDQELKAIKAVVEALAPLDSEARERVLKYATERLGMAGKAGPPSSPPREELPESPQPTALEKKKRKRKAHKTPVIDKGLDLRPEGKPHFKDFYEEKKPRKGNQFYAVAVHYLTDVLQVPVISVDQVYTCLKEIDGLRPPANLYQALIECAHKGFLDTSDMTNIKLSMKGSNLVEHDLPRKQEPAAPQ